MEVHNAASLSDVCCSFLEMFNSESLDLSQLTVLCFSGKDLIGVQNLLKKHQALQAEIAGHEPRIKAVTQKGNAMVEEGMSQYLYFLMGFFGGGGVWFFVFQKSKSLCAGLCSVALYHQRLLTDISEN